MVIKRLGLALLGVLLVLGCATGVMNVSYTAKQEPPLKIDPIYLKVKDMRTDRSVLSPAVKAADIFAGGGIGYMDLDAKNPQGRSTQLKETSVEKAFEEAFRMRFGSRGLGLLPEAEGDKPALIIEVERLYLDLADSSFKAEVSYLARFYKNGKEIHKERISGRAERFKILARKTAEEAISEAFTMSVNSLDLEAFQK
ncbi:MAG: hypothetical protein KKB20_02455 [Proteobacteria bacterium]|nr:hypothetical protein [Pseudomonadota bacterium]